MANKTNRNNSRQAAQVATINPETINANEPAIVAAQDSQTDNTPETTPEFPHLDNFPTLAEGLKFEVNGYKVTITAKEYIKVSETVKYPFTAWSATVVAPDGTTKDFAKVRNTAICNFCHASTGITHDGNGGRITKVLTDDELAKEATRRHDQICGMMTRAAELATKYGTSVDTPEADRYTAIYNALKEENDSRRESADKAKANNEKRQARKETRDLTAEISKLIAAGNFQKAAELMQQKAAAQTAEPETATDGDENTK